MGEAVVAEVAVEVVVVMAATVAVVVVVEAAAVVAAVATVAVAVMAAATVAAVAAATVATAAATTAPDTRATAPHPAAMARTPKRGMTMASIALAKSVMTTESTVPVKSVMIAAFMSAVSRAMTNAPTDPS